MTGRACVITGANSGIGKATALGLAQLGAGVAMVCRDRIKGEAARAEIAAQTGNPDVALFVADLSSQAQVRRVAGELTARYPALHVLIHNAGLQLPQRTLSADGIEMTLAVNHLAPFLLTHLLWEALRAGAPARVIVVSSMVHKWGALDLDNVQLERGYSMDRAYAQSKLCNVLFTRALTRRLAGAGVTANSLEPGLVKTEFARAYTGAQAWFVRNIWLPLFGQSPEAGARTSIYLAASPEVATVSGGHFAKQRPAHVAALAQDDGLAERLWALSEQLTGLSAPSRARSGPSHTEVNHAKPV
jgi:NAD(P)-dependent dehydrogenase (short-subunit alcohol dehydrogenase family)